MRLRSVFGRAFGWLTERLYRELAWAYDAVAWTVSLGRWSRWRREAPAFIAGPPVLEIGFGTGELLLAMRQAGIAAVGADLSPEMQRITRRKARRRRLVVPAVLADARALPFVSGSFGTVVATFPAGCILSPLLMAECARVLIPAGGCFVVVGLYVESDSPFLKLPAWLVNGGNARAAVAAFEEVATAAGFTVALCWRKGRGFDLPVYALRRRPGPDEGIAPVPAEGASA